MPPPDQISISRPYNIRLPKQYSISSKRRPLLFFHTHHRQSHRMFAVGGIVYLLGRESPYLPPVNSNDDLEIPPANICSPRFRPQSRVDRVSECKQTFPLLDLPRTSLHHHYKRTSYTDAVLSIPVRTILHFWLVHATSFTPYSLHKRPFHITKPLLKHSSYPISSESSRKTITSPLRRSISILTRYILLSESTDSVLSSSSNLKLSAS